MRPASPACVGEWQHFLGMLPWKCDSPVHSLPGRRILGLEFWGRQKVAALLLESLWTVPSHAVLWGVLPRLPTTACPNSCRCFSVPAHLLAAVLSLS